MLDNYHPAGFTYRKVAVLGKIEELDALLEKNTLDEIAITLSLKEYENLKSIVAACEKSGVHTKFIPDYNKIIPTIPYTEDLQGLPVINIRHVPLNDLLNATVKRMMDIFGAVVAIILFSPVMLLTVILIADLPGPVIYRQERVGLHNHPFQMYKFRSMAVQPRLRKKASGQHRTTRG